MRRFYGSRKHRKGLEDHQSTTRFEKEFSMYDAYGMTIRFCYVRIRVCCMVSCGLRIIDMVGACENRLNTWWAYVRIDWIHGGRMWESTEYWIKHGRINEFRCVHCMIDWTMKTYLKNRMPRGWKLVISNAILMLDHVCVCVWSFMIHMITWLAAIHTYTPYVWLPRTHTHHVRSCYSHIHTYTHTCSHTYIHAYVHTL